MLTVIVASGATVRLTGSGLGCKHWPGCTAGQPLPEQRLPLLHRVRQPHRRRAHDLRRARGLRSARCCSPALSPGCACVAGAAFVGHARPGAARRDHRLLPPQSLARAQPLPALDRRHDARRDRRARGLRRPRRAGAAGGWRARARSSGPRWRRSSSPARSRPPPARTRAAATCAGSARSSRRCGCTCGRSRCSASPSRCSASGSSCARSRHLRAALAVLGLLAVQMVIGEVQYRTHLPWGLVLVHVALAALLWAATVAFVARLWRPWSPA